MLKDAGGIPFAEHRGVVGRPDGGISILPTPLLPGSDVYGAMEGGLAGHGTDFGDGSLSGSRASRDLEE